jgi:hypothetical protein
VIVAAVSAQDSSSAPSATPDCDQLRFRKTGFWDIDIDNYPALPPECGAPISIHADRNPAHLPVQIVGLLASYVACTIAVGISILSIRKKRKQRLGPKSVELKLVLSGEKQFDPSIGSPNSSIYSWMRNPLRKKQNAGSETASPPARSPGIDSVASFDQKVLDQDRLSRQAEMDRLYAAVMAHDEARRSQLSQTTQQQPTRASAISTVSKMPDKRLTRVTQYDEPRSPVSPVRAIYPPDHEFPSGMAVPLSPTSPIRATVPDFPVTVSTPMPGPSPPLSPITPTTPRVQLPNDMYPASPPPGTRRMKFPGQPSPGLVSPDRMFTPATIIPSGPKTPLPDEMYPASPTIPEIYQNIAATTNAPSTSSSKGSKESKGRKMLRNIRINTSVRPDEEERAPLSATFQQEQQQQQERANEPPTPPTAGTMNESDESAESSVLPRNELGSSPPRRPPALRIPSANQSQVSLQVPPPGGLPQAPKSAMSNTSGGSKPLPLRVAFPEEGMKSPTMRTTVLQPRKDNIGRGPRTARTPMTGVPQTPYTPYMPYTPVTPITPHLVTRRERKEQKKMEGKTLLDESDLVKEEDEDWE